MFHADQYELLDFGEGRKLERFGALVLDRPAPATVMEPRELDRDEWLQAAKYARTEGERGRWTYRFPLPSTWEISHGQAVLQLKPTEFGHVGVFAEQAENWDWLAEQVAVCGTPLKVLNLFAYTGGSTLAVAAAGAAETVHIDAAENTVAWARTNAALSGMADKPIRWIAEDAEKFVRRELKRGNRYDAVIFDPPTYGHGPRGEVWKVADDLPVLLSLLAELTDGNPKFLLGTCHSAGITPQVWRELIATAFDRDLLKRATTDEMQLVTASGRELASGSRVRINVQ